MQVFITAISGAIGFLAGGLIGGTLTCIGSAGWPFNPYISGVTALIGVGLGVGVSEWRHRRDKRETRQGHFEALAAEIRATNALANGYLKARVQSPLYRLPVVAFSRSLPEILASGVLSATDSDALISFHTEAQSINRSFEYAHELLISERSGKHSPVPGLEGVKESFFDREVRRTKRKMKRFSDDPGTGEIYRSAKAAIAKYLPPDALRRANIDMAESDL